MKNLVSLLLTTLLITSNAFAATGTDKQIDSIQNSVGGSALSVPSVGTTFSTDTNTLTMSNKTLSAPTLTGTTTAAAISASGEISSSAAGTGLSITNNASIGGTLMVTGAVTLTTSLAVAQGGTGAATLTAHNVLLGEGTSTLGFAAPTQYLSLIGNASGDPSFQALALNQSTAVSGQLAVANGGTGDSTLTQYGVLMGNGTSAVTVIGPSSNSGYVLTSNGASSAPTYQAPPMVSPSINGSAASPQSVVAATGIVLTTPTYYNVVFVTSAVPSAITPVTATPSITACTAAGQLLYIISESATDQITLQNNADLSGSQVLLNGPWTSGENNGTPNTLTLICDGAATPNWTELGRQQ